MIAERETPKVRNMQIQTHERLTRDDPIAGSSNRAFGVVFTVVFAAVGLFPLIKGAPPRYWSLGVAALLLIVALVKADVLAPLNKVWFKFGLLLHRIVSPMVLALLFYAVVVPTGLIMRALGKDLLHLRYDRDAESYWIHRDPPGPNPESLKNQF